MFWGAPGVRRAGGVDGPSGYTFNVDTGTTGAGDVNATRGDSIICNTTLGSCHANIQNWPLHSGDFLNITFDVASTAGGGTPTISNIVVSGSAVSAIPLPAGVVLLGGGLAVAGGLRLRRRKG